LTTVVLLVATLALSACGSQQAGAAAIVNGSTISEKNVQTVSTQLNTLAQGEQKLTSSIVLLNLILAPYVLAEADRAGKGVPDVQARKVIAKVDKPSRQTLDFVRMQLAIPSLTTAAKDRPWPVHPRRLDRTRRRGPRLCPGRGRDPAERHTAVWYRGHAPWRPGAGRPCSRAGGQH